MRNLNRIGLGGFDLARRQVVFLPFAAALLLGTSLLSARAVRRLAVFGLLAGVILLVAVIARRSAPPGEAEPPSRQQAANDPGQSGG